jgi:hypothetical protein
MEHAKVEKFRNALGSLLTLSLLSGCGGGGADIASTVALEAACVTGGAGIAMLSWIPPSTDTNGDPIAIQGFRIYCSVEGGSLQWIGTAGASDTNFSANGVSGALTFAVTAISSAGVESDFSNLRSKTY